MKQIFTLLSLLILMGMSANVMAQSTFDAPYPGSTHTYRVNGGTATSGNIYTWSVFKGSIGTDAPAADYDISAGASDAEKIILWGSDVLPTDMYYVQVIEETTDGCQNTKVLPVTITLSNFYVSITPNVSTSCYTTDVVVTLDGTEPQYDHGYADVVYTITPTNNQGNWKFDFSGVAESTDYTVTAPTEVTAGTATISGSTVTATSSTPVQLTFRFTRVAKLTNTTDPAGTSANFDAVVEVSNGFTGATYGTKDMSTEGIYSATTEISRPATTAITGL